MSWSYIGAMSLKSSCLSSAASELNCSSGRPVMNLSFFFAVAVALAADELPSSSVRSSWGAMWGNGGERAGRDRTGAGGARGYDSIWLRGSRRERGGIGRDGGGEETYPRMRTEGRSRRACRSRDAGPIRWKSGGCEIRAGPRPGPRETGPRATTSPRCPTKSAIIGDARSPYPLIFLGGVRPTFSNRRCRSAFRRTSLNGRTPRQKSNTPSTRGFTVQVAVRVSRGPSLRATRGRSIRYWRSTTARSGFGTRGIARPARGVGRSTRSRRSSSVLEKTARGLGVFGDVRGVRWTARSSATGPRAPCR